MSVDLSHRAWPTVLCYHPWCTWRQTFDCNVVRLIGCHYTNCGLSTVLVQFSDDFQVFLTAVCTVQLRSLLLSHSSGAWHCIDSDQMLVMCETRVKGGHFACNVMLCCSLDTWLLFGRRNNEIGDWTLTFIPKPLNTHVLQTRQLNTYLLHVCISLAVPLDGAAVSTLQLKCNFAAY